jgi:hypothetical protein
MGAKPRSTDRGINDLDTITPEVVEAAREALLIDS